MHNIANSGNCVSIVKKSDVYETVFIIFRQKLHSQERHDNVATETSVTFH